MRDLARGCLVRSIEGHTNAVRAVALTPEGATVVSGSGDKSIRLWDRAGGVAKVLFASDAAVTCLALTRDGRWLSAGDSAGRVWIF